MGGLFLIMCVSYYKKFWKLLIDKDINKADLRGVTGLSPFTLAELVNGKDVSTSMLKRICEVMKCDVGDILEIRVNGEVM